MAKNVKSLQKSRQTRTTTASKNLGALDPNELKSLVRDGLVAMTMADREEFIRTLEADLRRANLNMRAYLIPLGIPGRSPEDLTPTEVGHLVRFFKINVPQSKSAIEKALSKFSVFAEKMNGSGDDRIAA